jgi:hypothetical protein
MTLSLIDPNTVALIGENSILKLQEKKGGDAGTLASFWRVLHSPAGPGHTLFIRSDALPGGVRIFSDNPALVRFMQSLEALMRKEFADAATAVEAATFTRTQSGVALYSESAATADGEILLEWRNLGVPFMTRLEPNNAFVGAWSVYSCLVPAREAALTAFGRKASGQAFPDVLEGTATSTSFLALGEIWLAPKAA